MKILIVDDQPKKYQRLITSLEAKFGEGVIEVCGSIFQAQTCLEKKYYDLLVLDIMIPNRPQDDPAIDHSIRFIYEIHEGEPLIVPGTIVGITADKAAAVKASPVFSDHLWTVIEFAEDNDEWMTQIQNCVEFIEARNGNKSEIDYGLDLAIICALRDPELSAVLSLPWNFKAAEPLDENLFFHSGEFQSEGNLYTAIACSAPRMGMVSTALTAAKIIEQFRPRFLIMTGICAGIRGKTELGDVIFADPVWDWQAGKYVTDANNEAHLAIAPHQFLPPHSLKAHMEQIKHDKKALLSILEGWDTDRRAAPNIIIGPVASGSAVIANTAVVDDIKIQQRNVCGIEMEAYGLFFAGYYACKPQPLIMAIKGVCDFADPHKGDDHQKYASYASAKVMQIFFERYAASLIK